jgi:hypothetical protein
MACGEIDLSIIDSVEENYKIISQLVSKFNEIYPTLKHTKTKTSSEYRAGEDVQKHVISLTFTGLGIFRCLACSTNHIVEPKGIKVYYDMDKKIGYFVCPGLERYRAAEGKRTISKSYIIYSSDDIDGPIIETEASKILYSWLLNEEKLTINRNNRGRGIGAVPLYDRFIEYCEKNNMERLKDMTKQKFTRTMKEIIGKSCTGQNITKTESTYHYLYY